MSSEVDPYDSYLLGLPPCIFLGYVGSIRVTWRRVKEIMLPEFFSLKGVYSSAKGSLRLSRKKGKRKIAATISPIPWAPPRMCLLIIAKYLQKNIVGQFGN